MSATDTNSSSEITTAAIEAAEAGATILHLHARDPETGKPTQDPDVFAQSRHYFFAHR